MPANFAVKTWRRFRAAILSSVNTQETVWCVAVVGFKPFVCTRAHIVYPYVSYESRVAKPSVGVAQAVHGQLTKRNKQTNKQTMVFQ